MFTFQLTEYWIVLDNTSLLHRAYSYSEVYYIWLCVFAFISRKKESDLPFLILLPPFLNGKLYI